MWVSAATQVKINLIKARIEECIPPTLVIAQHDEYGHKYRHTPSGKVFASVTTKTGILENDRLKRWAANLAVEYLDRNWNIITPQNKEKHYKAAVLNHEDVLHDAGDIGTQGHAAIERYLDRWMEIGQRPNDIRDFIIGEDARLWAITRSAEKFCIDFEVIPLASELKVASVKHGYAGTLDSLMMVKKGDKYIFAIVDFKTSNSIDKPEYAMQVSAYKKAFFELTGLRVQDLLILQLDKDKMKYDLVRVLNPTAAFRAFKNISKVYDYINGGVSLFYKFTPKTEKFFA